MPEITGPVLLKTPMSQKTKKREELFHSKGDRRHCEDNH